MRITLTAFVLLEALMGLCAEEPDPGYPTWLDHAPGLVAHWRFEETIDPHLALATDGRHLEVDEAAMRGTFFPGGASLKLSARVRDEKNDYVGRTEQIVFGEAGVSGRAFRFTGKNSAVYLFRDPGLEPGMSDFSFELWIKPDTTEKGGFLVCRVSPLAKAAAGIFFQTRPQGGLSFTVSESRDRSASVSAPERTIVPGRWQHVVAVRRGATLALYVDGALITEASGPLGLRIPPYGDYSIGADDWGGRGFVGLIDEVAYYNAALTGEVIAQHSRSIELTP